MSKVTYLVNFDGDTVEFKFLKDAKEFYNKVKFEKYKDLEKQIEYSKSFEFETIEKETK